MGFFQFFRNFILLVSVFSVNDSDFYYKTKKLLSNPIWFLESPLKYDLLGFSLDIGVLLIFTIPPALGFVAGVSGLFKTTDIPDAKNFSIALTAICCWLLTLPVFYVYVLAYGVPNP